MQFKLKMVNINTAWKLKVKFPAAVFVADLYFTTHFSINLFEHVQNVQVSAFKELLGPVDPNYLKDCLINN